MGRGVIWGTVWYCWCTAGYCMVLLVTADYYLLLGGYLGGIVGGIGRNCRLLGGTGGTRE